MARGGNPRTTEGLPVFRIVDTFGVKGKTAALDLSAFEDHIINLQGKGESFTSDMKFIAQQFGNPFFIGQKYPAFKPVYMALQDSIDYKAELFFEGAEMLDPRNIVKLPEASKEKLSGVIQLGNSQDVQTWYDDNALVNQFGLNPKEIEAYKRIQRVYKYATGIEMEARKVQFRYGELDDAGKAMVDEKLAGHFNKLGGYVSQTRAKGEWAVYQPPEVGRGPEAPARFFNLYENKSDAVKAQELLGADAKVYLRKHLDSQVRNGLSMSDLESLVQAAGVSSNSSDIAAIRKEMQSRGFSSHYIQRKNVPGYDWSFNNIVSSAVDYMEGASTKLAKAKGNIASEKAFQENGGLMSPELRAYARDYIEAYNNSGAIGFQTMNRIIYGYKLAFKVSWLAQNLTQPIATTYPAIAQYYGGVAPEKLFIESYAETLVYMAKKFGKKLPGVKAKTVNKELEYLLGKLHRQGVLGDQLTSFQLGIKNISKEKFEEWLGLFGRIGEGTNRTHAAVAAYKIATDRLGMTNKRAKAEFMKEFVYKTQFAYGKQNLPTAITGAGNAKNLVRTMYTFRHFMFNYMQMLNGMMPWRGAGMGQTMRALGSLLVQSGIHGAPFAGLAALGYKAVVGRTFDNDYREAMTEAGVPNAVIDLSLHGAYTPLGVDVSNLVGAGDIIPTYGTAMESVVGAPAGMARQFGTAVWYAERGEYGRALENASPDFIRNALKGRRVAREGMRKASGELISTVSKKDAILQGLGFTPLGVSKAFAAADAKDTMLESYRATSSRFSERLAKAMQAKDQKEVEKIRFQIKQHNASVGAEMQVRPSRDAVKGRLKLMRGRDDRGPRQMRRTRREIEERFGVKK